MASHSHPPSAWSHRRVVFLLAILGCGISTYLTLYQWRLISEPWDPVFGSASTAIVLSAFISHYLPLPDATLGAIAYLVEAILVLIGDTERYRTRTWLVLVFGVVVIGMAVASVGLVAVQAFILHAFCTLCLGSAVISWINAWLSRDEIRAALYCLRTHCERALQREQAEDRGLWHQL